MSFEDTSTEPLNESEKTGSFLGKCRSEEDLSWADYMVF